MKHYQINYETDASNIITFIKGAFEEVKDYFDKHCEGNYYQANKNFYDLDEPEEFATMLADYERTIGTFNGINLMKFGILYLKEI